MHVKGHPDVNRISSKNRMHFLGPKITFGEIAKTLVKYGEFSESGGFIRNAQKTRLNPAHV